MGIKITNTNGVIEIDTQGSPQLLRGFDKITIKSSNLLYIGCICDGICVETLLSGTDTAIQLEHEYVDEIDGDTNITSNEILYNKLKAYIV